MVFTITIFLLHYIYFSALFKIEDKTGGSADVFRTLGEKWRGLAEESREEYRKKAMEDSGNLILQPSNSVRAQKVIKNMMKEVQLNSHSACSAYITLCLKGSCML